MKEFRNFFPLLLTYFIDTFGLAIVYPIFTPLFLEPNFNLFPTEITFFTRTTLLGFLIASFPLFQFFGAPLFGELSDKMGRKKILLITILGGTIGYALTGFGLHFRNVPLLWFGRCCTGFFAGNLTLCLAAIADISKTERERTQNFGWIGTVGGLSFVSAIFLGGSLVNPNLNLFFGPAIPFFLTSIFSFVNLLVVFFLFNESHQPIKPHSDLEFIKEVKHLLSFFKIKNLRQAYLTYFLFIICWVASMQFLSTYLIDVFHVSTNILTIAFVGIGVIWSLSNFLINPMLSKRFDASKTFIFALFCLSAFQLLTLIPQPLGLFLIHFFLATACSALSWTNGLATVSLNASKYVQGSILGLNQSVVSIASIISPIIGGFIAGYNPHLIYFFTGICALLAAILLKKQVVELK